MTPLSKEWPKELPQCTCDDRLVCEEGAAGPTPPHKTMQTGNVMYNLTDSKLTTDDYLVRSFDEFILKR